MLGWLFGERRTIEIQSERIQLRNPDPMDFGQWAALRRQSRGFLEPWEPRWSDAEFERATFRRRVMRYDTEIENGSAYPFFIFDKDGTLLGGVTLSNVRRGVALSGEVGYWMGEPHAGKGHMSEALSLLCRHAFGPLGLHRIQAACIPGNERSQRLLGAAGFTHEGLLRSYLYINGAWRDHELYALLAGEDQDRDRNRDEAA